MDRFWTRFIAFSLSWIIVVTAAYWANDPYHNDEGSGAGVVIGILYFPAAFLIWFLADKFVWNKICRSAVCRHIITFIMCTILYYASILITIHRLRN